MPTSKPRRSPKPQERQRDPERTRRLILEAAAAEFGAHGYAGARISAIAARAGVNQQLISYYFDGKEGLYQAMSGLWQERQRELVPPGTPLPEQLRRYALEGLHNPAGARLLAWAGLQYTGPRGAPDAATHNEGIAAGVQRLRELQAEGRLPAAVDPACLLIMLMAAAMAPTTLPHVIEGVCGVDPTSPEFVEHFADQVALIGEMLGLG
ncbi:TetR/AcrR family transcriptional regulator [Nocardia sp. CDC159]|uniref:TetR/AcrR family transcriptional regulator n=1 Tax=Nocardia pulmonis TaxID=2951408 RepID=A0A9X2IVQ6_9NOCA|nr:MULTISPECIES: TetR family transcriptional regulator [Nocardia]MCM6772045.1 TetR/AcrR family transcriptional regulator [Nocardia pulmonis]MCM6785297.1 TetR/AcrR family transcriptional regulator [Nocardia sp. CDC159]